MTVLQPAPSIIDIVTRRTMSPDDDTLETQLLTECTLNTVQRKRGVS